MGVDELGCELSVNGGQPSCRVAQPVVVVDQEEVVAGIQDPAESCLPTQVPAIVIVLEIAGKRHPGTELRAYVGLKNTDRKTALGQFDACPFVAQADDEAVLRPDGQARLKITASPTEIVTPSELSSKSDRALAAHSPEEIVAVEAVVVSRWQDNGIVRAHFEIIVEPFKFLVDAEANAVARMKVHLEDAQINSLRQHDVPAVTGLVVAHIPLELSDQGVVFGTGSKANKGIVLLDASSVDETQSRVEVRLSFVQAEPAGPQVVEISERRAEAPAVAGIVWIRRCDVVRIEAEILVPHEASRCQIEIKPDGLKRRPGNYGRIRDLAFASAATGVDHSHVGFAEEAPCSPEYSEIFAQTVAFLCRTYLQYTDIVRSGLPGEFCSVVDPLGLT